MIRRFVILAIVLSSSFAFELPEADAARRQGFFRRARAARMSSNRSRPVTRKKTSSSSKKLHQTHSSSAILDGFFGPFPGGQGHDASWYVGK